MKKFKALVLVILIVSLAAITLKGHQEPKGEFARSAQAEFWIRHIATNAPTPVYPDAAIQGGIKGWVDAAVQFDENGNFKRIKILESPDQSLSDSVIEAVKHWKLATHYVVGGMTGRLRVSYLGELRFFFNIRDGIGSVESLSLDDQKVRSQVFNKIAYQEAHRPQGAR